MRNKGKLDVNNTIWSAEASRILGISKVTFNKRLLMGTYRIACRQSPKGFVYSIFDVFKIAHPRLNDRQIEELILDYRVKKGLKKRAYKKRGSIK